jgi:hypothetical protein
MLECFEFDFLKRSEKKIKNKRANVSVICKLLIALDFIRLSCCSSYRTKFINSELS